MADAGYGSEANHALARVGLGVASVIPASAGRPLAKVPAGRFRRKMRRWFAARWPGVPDVYGRRAQAETAHSMMKRNLGASLRSVTPRRRRREMTSRSVVHNLMLGRADYES